MSSFLPLGQHPQDIVVEVKLSTCLKVSGCIPDVGWYKVPKDIYLGSSWISLGFLSTKRVSIDEIAKYKQVLVDIAVFDSNNATEVSQKMPTLVAETIISGIKKSKNTENSLDKGKNSENGQFQITRDMIAESGWKDKGNGLWARYGPYVADKAVTSLDLLFGSDAVDPRPGWSLRNGYLSIGDKQARVTVRQGVKVNIPNKPKLKINKGGKYKILQVADLHFSTGVGTCRDPFPVEADIDCEADPRTLRFLNKVLDEENPDLVVLTGDQVFGSSAPDTETVLLKAVAPFIDRKIPYAMVMGNHDDEGSMSREQIMNYVSALPYSLSEIGPDNVDGYGNYVLSVAGPKSDNSAMSLYFLDTHKKTRSAKFRGYDWIKDSQFEFLQKEREHLEASIRDYTHIHLSMAFFHIPLTEYKNTGNMNRIGDYRETSTAPNFNSGGRSKLEDLGVSVVSVGHDHVNDFCMFDTHDKDGKQDKMWLCYGGAVGEGGYGGYGGYNRRLRIFEIDTEANRITSWKRLEYAPLKSFDKQILVEGGEAIWT
ncbi:Metallo-dependent phosphatase [Nadsonia fulvescens var. elongata DSM 6958]|uniref:Metallo-dependent phosphatase n=1 Tax=Nadsonia fulvescens var. elongata DSM 6958 TaxID=857566 RepID=A0A1E3PM62_9ASCO|nr:Metallo-dependent phosphatase [Nadsonia fulvescens var. elongata DSM 6958]